MTNLPVMRPNGAATELYVQDTDLPGGPTLETNGTANPVQSILNLIAGSNVTLSPDDVGGVTIAASGGGGASYMDVLSPDKPTGILGYQQQGPVTVASGATQNLLDFSGADGYVDSIFLALDGGANADINSCTINIYYDGEVNPTVSAPLGCFFMATYNPKNFASKYIIYGADYASGIGSYLCRIPIPFTNSIKIDVVNGSGVSVSLWSTVEYQSGVANTWTNTRKLRVSIINDQTGIAPDAVVDLVNYTGGAAGRLLGVWMLEDDAPGSVTPNGATLEGAITLYVDGAVNPTLQSSGTEDFYGMGFYAQDFYPSFTGQGEEIGLTFVNSGTVGLTTGLYRFFHQVKRVFTSGLKITWNCGNTSRVSFTGTGTLWAAVFYYTTA